MYLSLGIYVHTYYVFYFTYKVLHRSFRIHYTNLFQIIFWYLLPKWMRCTSWRVPKEYSTFINVTSLCCPSLIRTVVSHSLSRAFFVSLFYRVPRSSENVFFGCRETAFFFLPMALVLFPKSQGLFFYNALATDVVSLAMWCASTLELSLRPCVATWILEMCVHIWLLHSKYLFSCRGSRIRRRKCFRSNRL